MEPHDELPSMENFLPYGLFQQSATASVESSPPKSSSTSNKSESQSKQSFSSDSISDDETTMMSKLAISQEDQQAYVSLPMECPTYVPQGVFSKVNETEFFSKPYCSGISLGLQHFRGGSYFQQSVNPLFLINGGEVALDGMGAQASLESNPQVVPTLSGGRLYGNESHHRTDGSIRFRVHHNGEKTGNRFEFPVENSPLARTQIHVYTDRKVNFAEGLISVIIQVLNPPHDIHMHPQMFEAVVRSPSGNLVPCRVRSSDSYILNSFVGNFKAEEEVGNYEVRVRMIIPIDKMARYKNFTEVFDGAFHGTAHIAISKNYALDSQQECLRIQCESRFGARGRQPESDSQETGACALESSSHDHQATQYANSYPGILCKLWGLTCDMRNNNLLYTDREAHQVFCVSPQGQTVFKFGRNSGVPASKQLSRPSGIAFDEAHNRFVICDKDNHRICFFSLDGQFISCFGYRGHKNGSFEYPWDVDVAPNGNLVVSDSKNKRIQLFDHLGNYLHKYTVFEVNPFEYRSQFDYPRGVCFDNTGSNIYVTDFNVNNVIRISSDLSRHHKLLPQGTLLRPQGLTMDVSGNLLVTDSRHDCIRYMNDRGEHLTTIRDIMKEPLLFPVNITTMAGGFVAVLNGNGSITIF